MGRSKKRQALIDGIAEDIRSHLQDGDPKNPDPERRKRGMRILHSVLEWIPSRQLKVTADYFQIKIEKPI